LWPLARLFAGMVALRNWLFDRGLRRVERLNKPVISVGNLAMGGTGKSPLCAELLKIFIDQGLRVALLSRGYGRRDRKRSLSVNPEDSWQVIGDEPLMIARRVPQAIVAVGPSRLEAARAVADTDPDLYLLDDGFQHRQLHRDVDIVLVDVTQDWPRVFPMSLYREGWKALRRADILLLTRWQQGSDTSRWQARANAVRPDLPVFRVGFRAERICDLDGRPRFELGELAQRKVAAFSAISHPHKFFASLTDLGAELCLTHAIRDHASMDRRGWEMLLRRCDQEGVSWLLMTEKDWVKLDHRPKSAIFMGFLAIEVDWENQQGFVKCVEQVLTNRKAND